jgi:hypothetical protein
MDPESNTLGETLPLFHIAPDALLTLVNEGLHSESFDLFLGVNSEFFADLDLDGQTVRVPARFALAKVSPHGAVAREKILDGSGQAMSGMGHSIGSGGTFVETRTEAPLRAGRAIARRPGAPARTGGCSLRAVESRDYC